METLNIKNTIAMTLVLAAITVAAFSPKPEITIQMKVEINYERK